MLRLWNAQLSVRGPQVKLQVPWCMEFAATCHSSGGESRDARSTVSQAVPLDKVIEWLNVINAMENCFSTLATFFFLWQMAMADMAGWQGGSRKHASISSCPTSKRPRCVGLHSRMGRNDSECRLAFALRGCEQRIIVFFLLGIFWITSKNMQWIGTDRNGYE